MIDVKSCRDINGNKIKIGDKFRKVDYEEKIISGDLVVKRITKEGYFITIYTTKGEKIFQPKVTTIKSL